MSTTPPPSPAFVTGATGFLGANLVLGLLARGCPRVACLVRPGRSDGGGRGDASPAVRLEATLREAAQAAGLDPDAVAFDRVVAVPGDLTAPGLGLDDAARGLLADVAPTACWHAAASLRYEDRHRDAILATNVDGTLHVLDAVAGLGIAEFHHVSTAYVAGTRTGEIPEGPVDGRHEPNNCYELSKRRGEELVEARSEGFERARILRPSIVIGNLATHRSTSTTGYYGFLDGLAAYCRMLDRDHPDGRDAPGTHRVRLVLQPTTALDLMPVDALVDEALDEPAAAGLSYVHLTNPFPVRLDRLRVGPESVVERLEVEFVGSRQELGGVDELLDDALDFYRPYLRQGQHFLRARDAGQPPARLELTDDDLVRFSSEHLRRHDAERGMTT